MQCMNDQKPKAPIGERLISLARRGKIKVLREQDFDKTPIVGIPKPFLLAYCQPGDGLQMYEDPMRKQLLIKIVPKGGDSAI